MERFWTSSYPEGVPADIDFTRYQSLVQLLEEAFRLHAARNAYVCMDRFMTYATLDARSRQLGAWLQATDLKRGARVAVMLPNLLSNPVAIAAILRAGFVVVNVNPLYTPRELEHQLADSGAEAIIILENFAHTLSAVLARTQVRHVLVASAGDLMGAIKGAAINFVARHIKKMVPAFSLPQAISFKHALAAGARMHLQAVPISHDDVAFLQYTGGTTGVAKGAMLTHRNIIANVLQCEAWLQPALAKPPKIEQLVIVCALPIYHIFALTACCLLGTRAGAMNILIPNPRDVGGMIKVLAKHPFNKFPAVNTLYNALLNHPDFAALDFSHLKVCNGGGMAVQQKVAEKWLQVTGCPIIEGYGLSETSPVVTCCRADSTAYDGTIGLPLPSTEVAILDEAEQYVPLGERGEIAIRGPQVMAGYWNRPLETRQAMTAEGFFKSGDIGIMDGKGYIRIVDRKKDMILVSGFNVYPSEVEAVAASHPGVLEAACIGIPDNSAGEAVKLIVVRKDPALTAAELMEHCRLQLTNYKRPKHVEFRDELPKSNVGKILRRALRDEQQTST